MKPNNKYRNNYCGSLTEENIGETVKLSGWIENIRDHGGVIFVDVRDEYGTVKVVSNDDSIFDQSPSRKRYLVNLSLKFSLKES